ncbi:hypothetical protein M1M98_02740 [Thermodesulfovibrionales bacterium]|nr:hypothetical protein [Thermodesulfovibrionales bacterium]
MPTRNKTYMCFQHTKGHENVIASPEGVAIPPGLLHFVRNNKRRKGAIINHD